MVGVHSLVLAALLIPVLHTPTELPQPRRRRRQAGPHTWTEPLWTPQRWLRPARSSSGASSRAGTLLCTIATCIASHRHRSHMLASAQRFAHGAVVVVLRRQAEAWDEELGVPPALQLHDRHLDADPHHQPHGSLVAESVRHDAAQEVGRAGPQVQRHEEPRDGHDADVLRRQPCAGAVLRIVDDLRDPERVCRKHQQVQRAL